MPVQRPSREYMETVVAGMQATIRARQQAAPPPVNAAAAAALFEPIPLLWGSAEYRVRQISYREGLRLQRLTMQFSYQSSSDSKPETPADLEAHERLLDETLALFWSFLDPKPSSNPFEDASPLEVGALASFFFTCQRIQNQPSRMTAVRLSPSIT